MEMEIRIRGFPRVRSKRTPSLQEQWKFGEMSPITTHVLLFTGAGSSSGQTTKHTVVVSPMTKSATHLCSDLYAVPLLLNGKGGLRKSFHGSSIAITFWTPP
jgi:hypothetical protein